MLMRARGPVGVVFIGLASLAACGSGSNSNESNSSDPEVSNFTGTPWVGTIAETIDCDGVSTMLNSEYSVVFTASGSGLTLVTTQGCAFDFTVSGDTASLSNGPLTCSVAEEAGVEQVTITSYSLQSPDGHNLRGSTDETATLGTLQCTATTQITATR